MSLIRLVSALGMHRVVKTLTFANTAVAQSLFTVTGVVKVNVIPVVATSLTSAADAYVTLGTLSDLDAMIRTTQATELDANEIWIDQNPDSTVEGSDYMRSYLISNGDDIILDPDAQVDTGEIDFYCYWTPISTDGLVVAA